LSVNQLYHPAALNARQVRWLGDIVLVRPVTFTSLTALAAILAAIVGPSGCGKTTLTNVLLGTLPPTEGDVLVGGVSVKQVALDTLRQMVGTVLQDDVLFAGSIADNISFFDAHADQQWIEQCAQMAAIAPEIAAIAMGYMGTVLSGGQKQRVLLARIV